ncbi:transposable element Tcb2 transposase [Trichonephila clavipes]|nr:transposable element Tcb2 transposase [Trichonephila clavipes]
MTTFELPPPLLTTIPHQREDVCALDRFSAHRSSTRRLAEKALYARRPVVCVPFNPSQQRARFLWSQERVSWANRDCNESRRPHVALGQWVGHTCSNIRESDRFGGCGIVVRGGIMLDGITPLHVFDAGSVTVQQYKMKFLNLMGSYSGKKLDKI